MRNGETERGQFLRVNDSELQRIRCEASPNICPDKCVDQDEEEFDASDQPMEGPKRPELQDEADHRDC
jgi:Pyruvate/2-oxoacid:ferredoxin oxidoreductase delta subunit